MNAAADCGDQLPVMTEHPNPANRPADPERGDSLRAWLIDALALGMGALAVFHYQPDGFVAGLIVFVGAYTLTHTLQGLNWKLVAGICEILLAGLAPLIHLCTLIMVGSAASGMGLVFTFLLPGIAQAYWIWAKWATTGHPVSPADPDVCGMARRCLGSRIVARSCSPAGVRRIR